MFLGYRIKQGAPDPANPLGAGFYSIIFQPSDFQIRQRFQIKHMSIKGPAGSALDVYVDNTFRDTTPRGDKNSWDPSQPLFMMSGQALAFYWNTGTGAIPLVTVDCHTDDVL